MIVSQYMSPTVALTKRIRALESRVKLLESKPASSSSLWRDIVAKHPNLHQYELDRRRKALQESAGILRKTFRQNPVAWQRKMREDRRVRSHRNRGLPSSRSRRSRDRANQQFTSSIQIHPGDISSCTPRGSAWPHKEVEDTGSVDCSNRS